MVVDFRVGQVALLATAGDELLETGLLLRFSGHNNPMWMPRCAKNKPRIIPWNRGVWPVCRLSVPGSWCMPTAQEVSQLLFFLAGEWGLGRLVEELLNLAINLSRHQCIYSVEKLLFKVGAGNIQQPLLLRQLIQLFSQCRSMPSREQLYGAQLRVLLQRIDQGDQQLRLILALVGQQAGLLRQSGQVGVVQQGARGAGYR